MHDPPQDPDVLESENLGSEEVVDEDCVSTDNDLDRETEGEELIDVGSQMAEVNIGQDGDATLQTVPNHPSSNAMSNMRRPLGVGVDFHIKPFPIQTAGAPCPDTTDPTRSVEGYDAYQAKYGDCAYGPFVSKVDWELARWAKSSGLTTTALNELLSIEGLTESLGLSYKNGRELNWILDKLLPRRPPFTCKEIEIAGETVKVHSRNIIACIKALYGDAAFAPYLLFKPERHYTTLQGRNRRLYHDMHTGDWWWEVQKTLEASKPGATVIPLLISSDRTQVTVFGSKNVYPLYLTIGNIPKNIRRKPSSYAQILLAYLPSSKLKHVPNDAARRRMTNNLFHSCLYHIIAPIRSAAVEGVIMIDGNGISRRVHPILASYIGDYPEQVLVTGIKTGECPKCDIMADNLGNIEVLCNPRDLEATNAALSLVGAAPRVYRKACKEARIKPIIHPFWEDLPYVDIYQTITPDVLHQLHQGVLKHLISWVVKAYGASEMNARCQRLVPNYHIWNFTSGITGLSRVTGKERDYMGRIILGVLIGARLSNDFDPSRMVRAVRSCLEFIYLARLPVHSSQTLLLLNRALLVFHENKSIFIDMGIRVNFKIPKLHACSHYMSSIKLFGSTDNYSTQQTERLHKDFAKEGYNASNTRDELPQMTTWLQRREQVHFHDQYICGQENDNIDVAKPSWESRLDLLPCQRIKLTKRPTVYGVLIEQVVNDYGASMFTDAFARFVVQWQNPGIRRAQLDRAIGAVYLPFVSVSAFHQIKFQHAQENHTEDVIHIRPKQHIACPKGNRKNTHGRFDTVLIHCGRDGDTNIQGVLKLYNYCCWVIKGKPSAYRVAQVRIVFSISRAAVEYLFPPEKRPPDHLVYVEWFTPFRPQPEPNSGLYKVSRLHNNSARSASIIPVSNITQSVHLAPIVGNTIPREWTSATVLEQCQHFMVNSYANLRTYLFFSQDLRRIV